jgi:hypothetical protein
MTFICAGSGVGSGRVGGQDAVAANYVAQQALQAAITQSNIVSGLGALPCP